MSAPATPSPAPRPPAASKFVRGRVVALKRWTDRLYSVLVDAAVEPFRPGQFGRIALPDENGGMIARPYSFVNAPHERPLEFYFITLDDGPLTRRLVALKPGDAIWVAPKASGFMTPADIQDADYLWLLSTGTALGPYLAICKTDEPWKRFRKIVLVHAVRTAEELTYQDTIRAIAAAHPEQFVYVPCVTREETGFALCARVPQAIEDGRLEARAGITLTAENSQVMICGNPQMVHDTSAVLEARGLRKNKRKEPGHITVENYW
ncbi:MAG: ferredoxin--NADP reductase [Pseudomonadota bacterium]